MMETKMSLNKKIKKILIGTNRPIVLSERWLSNTLVFIMLFVIGLWGIDISVSAMTNEARLGIPFNMYSLSGRMSPVDAYHISLGLVTISFILAIFSVLSAKTKADKTKC